MRDRLDKLLRSALLELERSSDLTGLAALDTGLERTRDAAHGDFASNVAMRGAKPARLAPRDLAARIIEHLEPSPEVEAVDIAGPGFINFRLAPAAYHAVLRDAVRAGDAFGRAVPGSGERILVEYVSANPTGPLHVGHGRHAAYGATLVNILRAAGHEIDAEYYINDAGRQMDILAASVWLRYAESLGATIEYPPNCYQGAYVREIAASLKKGHGARLGRGFDAVAAAVAGSDRGDEEALDVLIAAIRSAIGDEDFRIVLGAALDSVAADIRDDLDEFDAAPQRWFSESSLIETGAIDAALDRLRSSGFLYEQEGAIWFRTTDFGDDKDRVVVRENGARTYFASDIAYHLEKCNRGYDRLVTVLGSDHHGYVARLRAAIAAMGNDPDRLDVQLVQFVVLYRGEVKAQMSTRAGEYVTLRDLRREVGNDAARFFFVSRSNDQHLDFDLELAKAQTNDNPVYYVQYAHARVASMLQKLDQQGYPRPDPESAALDALDGSAEQSLLRHMSRYPEVVALAAEKRAPQHVVHYLRELAADFHSFYNDQRILTDDAATRDARVLLAVATQRIIRNALGLLGVSAPETM